MNDNTTETVKEASLFAIPRIHKTITSLELLLKLEQMNSVEGCNVKSAIIKFRNAFADFMENGGILTCDGDFFPLPEGLDISSVRSTKISARPYKLDIDGFREVNFNNLGIQNNYIKKNKQSFLFGPKFYEKNSFWQRHIIPTQDSVYKTFAKFFDKFMLDEGIYIQDYSGRSVGGMIVKLVYTDIITSLEP